MTVGIVGLGLIGGSFAKAYRAGGHRVLGYDADRAVLDFAQLSGACSGELTDERLSECDLILLAVCPQAAIDYLTAHAHQIGPHPVVIDCCGVKRQVCAACFPLAKAHGFTYLGGHPMAGNHNSGFKYASATLFQGAPMVIVPADFNDIRLLSRVKELLHPAGFRQISVTTAENHDRVIAFTSQLAHVAANAYIKSPSAGSHKGFSAVSYKDMTRVAWLNPEMWAELFLDNRDYLGQELSLYIQFLQQYQAALERQDKAELVRLLDEGRRRKEEVDGH